MQHPAPEDNIVFITQSKHTGVDTTKQVFGSGPAGMLAHRATEHQLQAVEPQQLPPKAP